VLLYPRLDQYFFSVHRRPYFRKVVLFLFSSLYGFVPSSQERLLRSDLSEQGASIVHPFVLSPFLLLFQSFFFSPTSLSGGFVPRTFSAFQSLAFVFPPPPINPRRCLRPVNDFCPFLERFFFRSILGPEFFFSSDPSFLSVPRGPFLLSSWIIQGSLSLFNCCFFFFLHDLFHFSLPSWFGSGASLFLLVAPWQIGLFVFFFCEFSLLDVSLTALGLLRRFLAIVWAPHLPRLPLFLLRERFPLKFLRFSFLVSSPTLVVILIVPLFCLTLFR